MTRDDAAPAPPATTLDARRGAGGFPLNQQASRVLLGAVGLTLVQLLARDASADDRLFRGPRSFSLPAPSTAIITDDFNGDGRPDFALTHETAAQVSVVFGHEETLLTPVTTYATGLSPVALASGDLDGSGHPDLVTVNSGSSTATVLLNRGDGTFTVGTEVRLGLLPRAAVLADFNGDGSLDVATSNLQSRDFNVVLGDGQGGFGASFAVPVGDNPHSLAAADFDEDGRSDLAVIHADSRGASVSLFRGRGDGSFDDGVRTILDEASAADPRLVVAGDFDDDGRPDLAVLTDRAELLFLRNAGSLDFEPRLLSAQGGIPASAVFAAPFLLATDYDADGDLDVVSKAFLFGQFGLRVHLNEGGGTFGSPSDVNIDSGLGALAFADLDGDSVLDAVATRFTAEVTVVRGLEPGRFDLPETLWIDDSRPVDVASFDLDANGHQDLIALSPRALHVFRGTPGGFLPREKHDLAGFAQDLVQGDFDGDGRQEVAWSDVTSGRVAVVFLGSDGRIERTVEHAVSELPSALVATDLDGDGRTDLVVSDLAAPALTVILRPADPAAIPFAVEVGDRPRAVHAARVNGDPAMDFLVATDERTLVFVGDGSGRLTLERSLDDLKTIEVLAASDLDRDGSIDLVAAVDTRLELLYAFLRDETPRRETREIGAEASALAVRDLDRDGAIDIAALARGSGALVILRGFQPGTESTLERYLAGTAPRAFLFHDVDGDGDGVLDCTIADSAARSLVIFSGASSGAARTFRRGDADSSGQVNLTDAAVILRRLFEGGRALSCEDAADTNDDGRLNLADAVGLLTYLFGGGAAPPAPGPALCGEDLAEDELGACTGGCI